ncbi:MAG: hypothetical protein ACRD4P_13865 [Bryobacteraceae bacterium]
MAAQPVDRKKRIETQYVEEARRASSIFPGGKLDPHEKPDFLLSADHGTIGIEVTELCREEPRAEAGRLGKVPDRAKEIYDRFPDAGPVDVGIGLWRAENIHFNVLTKSLADFVYANRDSKGTGFEKGLPQGYCHIGIHEPLVAGGRWHGGRAFDTIVAPKELLETRIAEKNGRVADYRLSAPEVWLLIVNDQFLGPGEVYARPDHLAQWKFPFDFDKVLLFSREPGGSGEVIEIQRG